MLDGWWVEGHVEGVTGWSIGGAGARGRPAKDAADLYLKLERVILPLFYGLPFAYAEVMRSRSRSTDRSSIRSGWSSSTSATRTIRRTAQR